MATSTLIQKLDGTALVPSSSPPGSYSVVATPDVSNRRQVETFLAGATVALGDWVAWDTSKTGAERALFVVPAATFANGNPLVVGVVLSSAESTGALTAGSKINVVISGYCENAKVDAAGVTASGIALVVDNTGAGIANALAATDLASACGVSLEAAAAGRCDVIVYKQF
jgi:hypothetical protein